MLRQATYTTPVTALYARLSKDDEQQGPSLSIENQKRILESYARDNGFLNYRFFVDDGWSGANFQRPGFMEMMDCVESGEVKCVITKDLSRMGRNYLQVGMFTEITFPKKGVRFIAINDGVDSAQGENDLTPLKNLFNEWMVRDTSKKIKAVKRTKGMSGKPTTTQPVYGYLMGEDERFIVDEEAAPVVKRIFRSVIAGKNIAKITEELTAERILTPNAHWKSIGERTSRGAHNADPYKWSSATVINILKKEEYMGWKVLNKTGTENYKSKQRKPTPENRLVFKDAHPQIIDEETWNIVQRLRGTKRRVYKPDGEPNPLTGVLYCADCGAKMYNHRSRGGTEGTPYPSDFFDCSSYTLAHQKHGKDCCGHYITTKSLRILILETIRTVSQLAIADREKFTERIRAASQVRQVEAAKDAKRKLNKDRKRHSELDTIIKKLYESFAVGRISEERFDSLLAEYEVEQKNLSAQIAETEESLTSYEEDTARVEQFLALAEKYTDFSELTTPMINEFIDKIIVHAPERIDGDRTQEVEIFLKFIGKFELPAPELTAEEIKRQEQLRQHRIKSRERYQLIKAGKHTVGQPFQLTCKCCGQGFESKSSAAMFCGPNCRAKFYRQEAAENRRRDCTCENCGKTFSTTRSNVKYCSDECRYEGHIKGQRVRNAANRKEKLAAETVTSPA